MAVVSAAEASLDGGEVELQLIVDNDDVIMRNVEVLGEGLDGSAGQVHEATRLGDDHLVVPAPRFGDIRVRLLMNGKGSEQLVGEFISHVKADVVAGTGVLRAGVS